MTPPPTTSTADHVLALVGAGGFKTLVECHGGTRMWMPKHLDCEKGQNLVQMVGAEAACRLANELGGFWVPIPNMRAEPSREPDVHRLLAMGMSHRIIAITLKITEKTVGKHAATFQGRGA